MHRLRAAHGRGTGFGESEKAHFAGANQIAHRADRLFDRNVEVDPVLVVKIDVIDVQTL